MPLKDGCLGCPFYREDKNFVEDRLTPDARMHIILRSPTYQAVRNGVPDVSEIQKGLRMSGVEEYSVGHLLRCAVPTKVNPAALAKAAKHCSQYTELPNLPIVTVGKDVFNFYGKGVGDTYQWRGFRVEVEV